MAKIILNINYTSKFPPSRLKGEKRAEYIARRNFYNLTAEYNYFSYTLNDKKIKDNATAEDYFQKSTGLFNLDGEIDEKKFAEIKKQLKTTDSIIWHGVISFDEETSLQFQDLESASLFLRKTFNSIIDQTHLDKNNLELFASLHKDTNNRHIHFAFFEIEPKHVGADGKKVYTAKGNLNCKAFENYLISSNMSLRENKDLFYTARNEALEALKGVRELTTKEFKTLILPIAEKLKGTGRLQYNSDNLKDLRPEIDKVSERLMKINSATFEGHKKVLQELTRLENTCRQTCIENSFAYVDGRRVSAEKLEGVRSTDFTYVKADGTRAKLTVDDKAWEKIEWVEKLRKDYYSRLGNKVIAIAREVNKTKPKKKPSRFNDLSYKTACRAERSATQKALNGFLRRAPSETNKETAQYLRRLREIEKEVKENEKRD